MILGIASALAHLHSRNIVHSNMKLENVFVSFEKKSLLANFSDSCRGIGSLDDTHSVEGSGRWQAYELLVFDMNGPVPPHTKETDVWAFGTIVYELLAHEVPYHHLDDANEVIWHIFKGQLPQQPEFSSDSEIARAERYMWSLCERSWILDPERRPSMKDLEKDISDFVRMETAQDANAEDGTVVSLAFLLRTAINHLFTKCFGRRKAGV